MVPQALEEDARLTALFLWTLQSTNEEAALPGGSPEEPLDDSDDEDTEPGLRTAKGLTLVHDVVCRFAQPLGIDLDRWEGRVIETKKGAVRLLPVAERAEQLFGREGAEQWPHACSDRPRLVSRCRWSCSLVLQCRVRALEICGRAPARNAKPDPGVAGGATTLDRVHAAMLLQASGQTAALRALIVSEQKRASDFLRLANALSALYPKDSEEKRLLDAMLLAVPR